MDFVAEHLSVQPVGIIVGILPYSLKIETYPLFAIFGEHVEIFEDALCTVNIIAGTVDAHKHMHAFRCQQHYVPEYLMVTPLPVFGCPCVVMLLSVSVEGNLKRTVIILEEFGPVFIYKVSVGCEMGRKMYIILTTDLTDSRQ